MPERSNGTVSKTVVRFTDRGFESLSLRRTYYTKWTVSRQKPTNQRLVAGNQLRVYLQSLLTSTLQELRPALPPP